MAKLLYSATMSLDGFIAGVDGDMSWLTPHLGPNPEVDDLVAQVGSALIGNRTFRGDDALAGTEGEGQLFGGGWKGRQFVLTHRVPDIGPPGITFVDDLHEGVAQAKQAAGDKYVNIVGASVARQCVEAGLLDEVVTFVVPVLLGDGTRLFERPGGTNTALERSRFATTPSTTTMWFRVLSNGS